MKSVTFKIEGMHCDGCAQNIKALLTAEAGVHAADVSFKQGEGRVLYDPRAIDESRLVSTIERAGFKVPAREQ